MQTHFPMPMKLLITIVDRDKGQLAVNLLLKEKILFHRIALGRGTAKSEILDLLGIGDMAKDIIFSVMPSFKSPRALRRLMNTLQFDNPGHGIAFTIPICSVVGQRAVRHLCGDIEAPEHTEAEKENKMDTTKQYDLIISIVNNGYADDVMDAARPVGARGGTVLHARGAGIKEAEKFFGITIQPEKEMVFILAHREQKNAIMESIGKSVGMSSEAHGIVFSIAVDDVVGVARMMREYGEEDE